MRLGSEELAYPFYSGGPVPVGVGGTSGFGRGLVTPAVAFPRTSPGMGWCVARVSGGETAYGTLKRAATAGAATASQTRRPVRTGAKLDVVGGDP